MQYANNKCLFGKYSYYVRVVCSRPYFKKSHVYQNLRIIETEMYIRKYEIHTRTYVFHSSIPLACAECDDSLPFSGASSIPVCYVLFPTTLPHQLFFHPLSPHLAFYLLVYLSILLFPNSYTILFWEFYFLPFSVHAQTNIIYLNLLFLL